MITTVEAISEGEFEEWYQREPDEEEAAGAEKLLTQYGCIGCHSLDGSKSVGPTFQGLFGREVTVEKGGETQTLAADEEYIRESIRQPKAAIVRGFPPVMPDFADLTEEELEAIVDYIKELR
jgi:cytochrome c oxidase subunit 2